MISMTFETVNTYRFYITIKISGFVTSLFVDFDPFDTVCAMNLIIQQYFEMSHVSHSLSCFLSSLTYFAKEAELLFQSSINRFIRKNIIFQRSSFEVRIMDPKSGLY